MTLALFYYPLSQPSCAVLALLLVNSIPFEGHVVNIMAGEQKTPEFLNINPSGQVPAIKDGELVLAEGHAIMRYLCNSQKVEENWYPADPKERALVDWYLDWHHFNIRPITYYLRDIMAEKNGMPAPSDKEKELKLFSAGLDRIETQLLETNKYLVSKEKPTLADLTAIYEICQLPAIGIDISKYPKIQEWVGRMFAIEGVDKANEGFKQFVAAQKKKAEEEAKVDK
mmetsp:Transcript_21243/g.24683  ORF Transcript_21243/g.24683 Transcript_21243/m.24683 type:complete len:227 (-) Transcript_21243:162-842(-)